MGQEIRYIQFFDYLWTFNTKHICSTYVDVWKKICQIVIRRAEGKRLKGIGMEGKTI